MLTKEQIIDNYQLTFDPGDKLNGSLYIGYTAANKEEIKTLIDGLRQQNLWSAEEFKQVPIEHKPAYKDQLAFVESVSYTIHQHHWLIARFDHEKYPSDEGRWQAWKQFFDANFERAN